MHHRLFRRTAIALTAALSIVASTAAAASAGIWTPVASGTTQSISAVAYAGSTLVYGTSSGQILKTGVTTRQQLRDRLLQVRDFSGVSGLTSMNAEGDAEKVLYLLTIRDRKIRQLDVSPGS